jgi:hypothetical protein
MGGITNGYSGSARAAIHLIAKKRQTRQSIPSILHSSGLSLLLL